LGGAFYDFGKREYVIKKPLGVVALGALAVVAALLFSGSGR